MVVVFAEYLDLFAWHYARCDLYRTICDSHGWHPDNVKTLEDLPYLPAQYFKHLELVSTDSMQWLQSSGTGGTPSKIAVDRETIKRQQLALAKVLTPIIGEERKPWVVIGDANNPGIRGFLSLSGGWGTEDPGVPCVVVGFTVDVWNGFDWVNPAKYADGSVVLHIGGWKKIRPDPRHMELHAMRNNLRAVNLYGFTEQLGTVYPQYACGYHHCPDFARVIVRDPATHEPVKRGMGQFITNVPKSYPGFSVLTDDDIELVDCDCQPGQAFKVHGRITGSETRGCGDVHRR